MAEYKSIIDIASELRGKSVKAIYDALDYYFVAQNQTQYTDLATTIMDLVAEGGTGAAKDIATRFASPSNKYVMSTKQRWSVAYAFQKIDDSVVDTIRKRYLRGSSIAAATQSSLLSTYAKKIESIFDIAATEAATIAAKIRKINPDKLFSFNDYPQTHDRIDKLEKWMASELEQSISNNISEEWALAEAQEQALTSGFLHEVYDAVDREAAPSIKARYYRNNTEARSAFLARRDKGMGLSDRVWKLTEQCRQEMEMAIDIGLGEGLSAQKMSQSIRQYLREPNKLFRRVRDKHGNLVLSQAAKAYHPGQGVYRSSYKNALRLSTTEGNIAYRTADHLKWQQLDFVVGIKIGLSNNHTLNGVPFHDICDELAGRYPKDFKFTGWHPFCRCIVTTILMTPEEFKANEDAFLDGKEPTVRSKNQVDDVPRQFKKWVKDNAGKIKTAKSLPYFVRDNEQYFNPTRITKRAAKGVRESQALNKAMEKVTDPTVLREQARKAGLEAAKVRHANRTPEQIADIQRRWDERAEKRILDIIPSELHPKSTYLEGEDYLFDVDFFKLVDPKYPINFITDENYKGYCEAYTLGNSVTVKKGRRYGTNGSVWGRKAVVYHEFGHCIVNQRGLTRSKELLMLRDNQLKSLSQKSMRTISREQINLKTFEIETIKETKSVSQIDYVYGRLERLYKKITTTKQSTLTKWGVEREDILEQIGKVFDTLQTFKPSLYNRNKYGHTTKYWSLLDNREHEYLAHAFENTFIGNRIFEKYLPDLYKEMVEYIKTLQPLI